MKKIAYLMLFTMVVLFSCKKDKEIKIHTVTVQLAYPATSSFTVTEGVTVKMAGKGTSFEAKTNAEGKATFSVPTDIYEISATDPRSNAGIAFIYNGLKSNIAVVDGWNSADIIKLDLTESTTSQIVIKEVFTGGSVKEDGTTFSFDGYVILYNNSDTKANLGNLCIGTIGPANSTGTNNFYTSGKLLYEDEKWMPALSGFWHFQQNVSVDPGKQIVIALHNAVNNAVTHPKSINFANPEYYAMYDVATPYKFASYYVSPSELIPTSHYLKAIVYGTGTAWTPSFTSPGIFIFDPKGTTPAAFGADATTTSALSAAYTSKKVKTDWIVDGIEAFSSASTENKKRFLPNVDAGYVYHINKFGYSIYRNVDKAATEALAANNGKLVYNYNLGTTTVKDFDKGSTDPSGIDAEASIKKGARIIYKDTNNSTNDTHLRLKASLSNY